MRDWYSAETFRGMSAFSILGPIAVHWGYERMSFNLAIVLSPVAKRQLHLQLLNTAQ